jgi:hypothetical protein
LKNALEELVKENKIEKIEVNKGTYWKLKKWLIKYKKQKNF